MAARRTDDAIDAFLNRLRRTAECITDQPILSPKGRSSLQRREATFVPRGGSARLRSTFQRRTVLLQIAIDHMTTEADASSDAYATSVVSYSYRLLNIEEREILAFHWHPVGLSDVTDPHVHLTSRLNAIDMGRDQDPLPLAGMHIPTGFVTLEDVVRLLVAEFGVDPRHADWDTVLRENRMIALAQQAR